MKGLELQIVNISARITVAVLDGNIEDASNLTLLLNDLIDKCLKIKRLYKINK